jgi:AcrR family transcriptional regulator
VQAALAEIEVAGVRGLAVENVARRLGVDKVGFFHHFVDRRALLRAALAQWRQRWVVDLGTQLESLSDPRERLHTVLVRAVVELRPTVIIQLMAAADDPDVAAVLAQAADARVGLLRRALLELGVAPEAARRRALLTYAAYLGLAELRTQMPDELLSEDRLRGYVDELEMLVLHDFG